MSKEESYRKRTKEVAEEQYPPSAVIRVPAQESTVASLAIPMLNDLDDGVWIPRGPRHYQFPTRRVLERVHVHRSPDPLWGTPPRSPRLVSPLFLTSPRGNIFGFVGGSISGPTLGGIFLMFGALPRQGQSFGNLLAHLLGVQILHLVENFGRGEVNGFYERNWRQRISDH